MIMILATHRITTWSSNISEVIVRHSPRIHGESKYKPPENTVWDTGGDEVSIEIKTDKYTVKK